MMRRALLGLKLLLVAALAPACGPACGPVTGSDASPLKSPPPATAAGETRDTPQALAIPVKTQQPSMPARRAIEPDPEPEYPQGSVVVRLRTTAGEVVSSGTVVASIADRPDVRAQVDRYGVALFEGLEGLYRFDTDPESLPAGLIGPWPEQVPSSFVDTKRTPTGTYRVGRYTGMDITLTCYRPARVCARVLWRGQPVRIGLGLDSTEWGSTPPVFRTDDEDGTLDLIVRPGSYRLTPAVHWSSTGAATLPAPIELEVSEGAEFDVELHCPEGTSSVRGRLADQYGEPIAGLNVTCSYVDPLRTGDASDEARAQFGILSSGNGDFVVEGLPAGDYRISIADQQSLASPGSWVRENKGPLVAHDVAPIDVYLREGESKTLGTPLLVRAELFTLRGQVRQTDEHRDSGRLRAELVDLNGAPVPTLGKDPTIDKNGRFTLRYHATDPARPVKLRVYRETLPKEATRIGSGGPEELVYEGILLPTPHADDEIEIVIY